MKDVNSVMELHKASQIPLHSNDPVLEEINSWTREFLKEYLSYSSEQDHKPLHNIDHEVLKHSNYNLLKHYFLILSVFVAEVYVSGSFCFEISSSHLS